MISAQSSDASDGGNVRVLVGGTVSWPHIDIFLSWCLIQPGSFL